MQKRVIIPPPPQPRPPKSHFLQPSPSSFSILCHHIPTVRPLAAPDSPPPLPLHPHRARLFPSPPPGPPSPRTHRTHTHRHTMDKIFGWPVLSTLCHTLRLLEKSQHWYQSPKKVWNRSAAANAFLSSVDSHRQNTSFLSLCGTSSVSGLKRLRRSVTSSG